MNLEKPALLPVVGVEMALNRREMGLGVQTRLKSRAGVALKAVKASTNEARADLDLLQATAAQALPKNQLALT